ncbi:MAG TPA: riboflavin synthase [Thermoanaerobaculia bacterium]|nr:riboflavin synthase [Thermoanaerobaculia bacterium]
MFTGIVRERGRVLSAPAAGGSGGWGLTVGHSAELAARLEVGASLAVAGVCLTVTELAPDRSRVEISPETMQRTRLGDLARGDEVNLEPALRVGDALGGHWVQGHVDATVRVLGRRELGGHREITFSLPASLAGYVVEKGSVAIDGVSLTVSRRAADRFAVAVIPHTLRWTTLEGLRAGQRVHLEVDILAKYVEQLLARTAGAVPDGGGVAPPDGA